MNISKSHPIAIATWPFGKSAVEVSGEILSNDGSALDAVEKGINVVELDTTVTSVGFGGIPNSEGVVELDAAIMDGVTHSAGSVAGLRNIRLPISVARKVMENTKHVMLVGDNALEFAISQGLSQEELLTENSKQRWEKWKSENPSGHDTIGLVAIDQSSNLATGCSTSGLGYKLPGRVGDSPIIGSGLYVDNDVGGASATGLGEEIMKFCASFLVVEFMRNGYAPPDACQKVIDRILTKTPKNRDIMIGLIALSKNGEYGAATTKGRFSYAVWKSEKADVYETNR